MTMARLPAIVLATVLMTLWPSPVPAQESRTEAICRYDARLEADLSLNVDVRCDGPVSGLEVLDPQAQAFMSNLAWEMRDGRLIAHYELDLAGLADAADNIDVARRSGQSVVTVASSWLPKPINHEAGADGVILDIGVITAPGLGFASAIPKAGGRYRIRGGALAMEGYAVFGKIRRHRIPATLRGGGQGAVQVVLMDGPLALSDQVLVDWIADTSGIMSRFWHGLPAEDLLIAVLPRQGRGGVPFGRVMSGAGVSVALYVGAEADRPALYDDWVLIHEFIHVGYPFVRRALWFTEGMATYLEPVIRARSGRQTETGLWNEFMRNMPARGEPFLRSPGLANSGRRAAYWGGAVFMMLVDVELRKNSNGSFGLEDCLRESMKQGRAQTLFIGARSAIQTCDEAAGTNTMARLAERFVWNAGEPDLAGLWPRLGLTMKDGKIQFDESAPLAWVRRAMVKGNLGSKPVR